jgi:hypothetical protein
MVECQFGAVTRNMVENISTDYKNFKDEIRAEFLDLRNTNKILYNHLSSRLPPWATALGSIGMLILGAFIGKYIGGLI